MGGGESGFLFILYPLGVDFFVFDGVFFYSDVRVLPADYDAGGFSQRTFIFYWHCND